MCHDKSKNVRSGGNLSGCSITITCPDGTQRVIKCSSDKNERSQGSQRKSLPTQDNQPTGRRQSPEQYDSGRARPSTRIPYRIPNYEPQNTTNTYGNVRPGSSSDEATLIQQQKNNMLLNQQPPGAKNVNAESTLQQQRSNGRKECEENTYAAILERFNRLKEKMSQSAKKGDGTINPDKRQQRSPSFESTPDTERIITTKCGGANTDYVKETVIERSTLTEEGILTTTRHIIERSDKDGNIEYEVKESNRMSVQKRKGKGNFDSGIGRSDIDELNSGVSRAPKNSSSYGYNDPNLSNISSKNNRVPTTGTNQNTAPSTQAQPVSRSRTNPPDQIFSRTDPPNHVSRQTMTETSKRNATKSIQQMRGNITDDLNQQTMPSLGKTSKNTSESHKLLKCCPCVCRLCAMNIAQSISHPANRISSDISGEHGGRGRVDYYLVGELLQNRLAAEAGVSSSSRRRSRDFSCSEFFDKQPMSSTALPRGVSAAPNTSRKNYTSERLNDISAPSFHSSTAYSSGNEASNVEQLDNVSAPSFHSSPLSSATGLNFDQPSNQPSEHLSNISAPSMQSTATNTPKKHRSDTSNLYAEIEIPNEFNRELQNNPEEPFQTSDATRTKDQYSSENISIPTEFNRELLAPSENEDIANITPPVFETSSGERIVQEALDGSEEIAGPAAHSTAQEILAEETGAVKSDSSARRKSLSFGNEDLENVTEPIGMESINIGRTNEDLQNVSEPSGMESSNNEEEERDGLDNSSPSNYTPRSGKATNAKLNGKKRLSKQRKSNISPKVNVRRDSRNNAQQCTNLVQPVVIPLSYNIPQCPVSTSCQCTEDRECCNVPRRIQICEPQSGQNRSPYLIQCCDNSDEEDETSDSHKRNLNSAKGRPR